MMSGVCEAGCDEAGRGCLAGPVFAAAVVLPDDFEHPWLNDSKQLSERRRNELRAVIESSALAWCVAMVDNHEIDGINILNASILAMHKALDGLDVKPRHILVDGNRFKPYHDVPYVTVVKGDGKYGNIAAASILAKTHRDEYMCKLHDEYPQYGWNVNKGYPTVDHRNAIRQYGPTPYHRMSFKLLDNQLTLF
ncbi:MAG: ribonuclease HII [Muribaculaceae bacterium]|nr:ribonuclease HII [Muribaculaceae bacterium]